jgi:putative hydrolase of the HAD superfamily
VTGAAIEPVPIEAVCFDFAGTLFSDRELRDVHLRQLQFVADAAGVAPPDDELRAAYVRGMGEAAGRFAAQPSYSHRALFGGAFVAMASALGGEIDDATAQEAVDRQYRATIECAELRPDCLATLSTLREASVHVQIVSNIDDEQLDPMIQRFGLRDVTDAVTSSEQAASCKPDAAIYRTALDKAGVDAEQALFVGDSLRHDIVGPAAVGMQTAWLATRPGADPSDARPDHVIRSLADVLDIPGIKGWGVRRSGVGVTP